MKKVNSNFVFTENCRIYSTNKFLENHGVDTTSQNIFLIFFKNFFMFSKVPVKNIPLIFLNCFYEFPEERMFNKVNFAFRKTRVKNKFILHHIVKKYGYCYALTQLTMTDESYNKTVALCSSVVLKNIFNNKALIEYKRLETNEELITIQEFNKKRTHFMLPTNPDGIMYYGKKLHAEYKLSFQEFHNEFSNIVHESISSNDFVTNTNCYAYTGINAIKELTKFLNELVDLLKKSENEISFEKHRKYTILCLRTLRDSIIQGTYSFYRFEIVDVIQPFIIKEDQNSNLIKAYKEFAVKEQVFGTEYMRLASRIGKIERETHNKEEFLAYVEEIVNVLIKTLNSEKEAIETLSKSI